MPKRQRPSDHEADEPDPFLLPVSEDEAASTAGAAVHSSKRTSKKRKVEPASLLDDDDDEDLPPMPKKRGAAPASSDFFLPPSEDEGDDEDDEGGPKSASAAGKRKEDVLTVNERFAARMQKTAELQAAQRRRARYTGLAVPKGLVVAFNGEIKKALLLERSNAGGSLDEDSLVVADALSLLTVPDACRVAADKIGIPLPTSALPPAEAMDDSFDSLDGDLRGRAIARLLANAKVQDAQQQLIRAVQRAAAAAETSTTAAGSNKKKLAPGAPTKASTGVMVILGDGPASSSSSSSSSSSAIGAPRAKVQKFEAAAEEEDESEKKRKATALAAMIANATVPSASAQYKLELRQRREAGKPVHGRGAGKGRGLHPYTGEPKFEDKHPSWQDRTRASNRQAKLITKALRSKPAEAVEVPLELA